MAVGPVSERMCPILIGGLAAGAGVGEGDGDGDGAGAGAGAAQPPIRRATITTTNNTVEIILFIIFSSKSSSRVQDLRIIYQHVKQVTSYNTSFVEK